MNSPQSNQPESSSHQIPLFSDADQTGQDPPEDRPPNPSKANEIDDPGAPLSRHVYPLNARDLSEEQIAVVFAMTSRRPQAFSEIANEVSLDKAADFHERWVLGYGHASVAEHAVVHLAVENVSRLACDGLEDNRLASYTEKSSRYQVMDPGFFHVPTELDAHQSLRTKYVETCGYIFGVYKDLIEGCEAYLRRVHPQSPHERNAVYDLSLRRMATDACRAVLPAATLTNVGVTANARTLEHAISKLMSSELDEERQLGKDIREEGRRVTPTLIKYAERVNSLAQRPNVQRRIADSIAPSPEDQNTSFKVRLVHWDEQAEEKLVAAFLYRSTSMTYQELWKNAGNMTHEERIKTINSFLSEIGPHDAPPRELEVVDYTFEISLDYGAFREFKRHRMQTYLPQPLTVNHGASTPEIISKAGLEKLFVSAIRESDRIFHMLYAVDSLRSVAQYAVTHAHEQRLVSKLNLRECYHMFKLRTSKMAHESIREPMTVALELAKEKHLRLFDYLTLRV